MLLKWHFHGRFLRGCFEIELFGVCFSSALDAISNSEGTSGTANDEFFKGVEKYPYKAVSRALEIIPRTLIQNCGGNVVKQLTTLRAKHHQQADQFTWGIDGETGQLVDMHKFGIWEPIAVKMQTIKTAIEVRIFVIVEIEFCLFVCFSDSYFITPY